MALRDAGAEVVYLGQRKTSAQIITAAIDEDVDVVGLSILSGAHLSLTRDVLDERSKQGVDVPIVVGGTIPAADAEQMRMWGVARVYPAGSDLDHLVADIRTIAAGNVGGCL